MNIPKIIFIVPYRNRENEKIHFSNYMKYILEDYDKNDYEIYYSFQNDNRPFNRGAIKNIGFIAIKNKYINDYKNITFVFNDVDTLPYKKNILNYITKQGTIKHFFGFTFALGGIVSITGVDFEKFGGFPNNWGWGFEDNTLNDRALKNNIIIDRSNFFDIKSSEILQIRSSEIRTISNNETINFYKNQLNETYNNINNLNYTFDEDNTNNNEFIINITNFTTLTDPKNYTYFNFDVSKSNKIPVNGKKYQVVDNRWKMNF
tara:strand:+ start:452 stop:1234 length:783 start_codon:yes stop_codon:yes gene_type:complete